MHDVAMADNFFESLKSLLLSENCISSIEPPPQPELRLASVTALVLDGNPINDWKVIDAISVWLPNLDSLRLVDTPLLAGTKYTFSLTWIDFDKIRRRESTQGKF